MTKTATCDSDYIVDPPPSAERSRIMASVGQKDTRPELIVRRWLHKQGYRFRLHRKDLPGVPDIVLPGLRKVIFVHGCFWHRHSNCPRASMPRTRTAYWKRKFNANVQRDERARKQLTVMGWEVAVVWECEVKDIKKVERRLGVFLRE